MSLAIALIVGFLFIDSPWRWAWIGAAAVWEAFEISIFLKWRKVKARTGHETMVGTKGRTVTECRPDGQARVKGVLWSVTCPEGAARNVDVEVTETEGTRLTVRVSSEEQR